jgi:hypothetical protein
MKKVMIGIGIVIAIALVVCLVPLKEVAYAVMVDYEDTEIYYEDEPYLANETYIEDMPLDFEAHDYIRTDTIKEHHQIIIGGIVFQDEIVEVPIEVACVKVKNTDDIAGNFTVSFSGFEPMFGELSLTTTLSLNTGQQKIAECPADSIDNWSYEITPSTKEVEAERTVTKYRQVEKQRIVTKQRQEIRYKKVTLLDYLLHY